MYSCILGQWVICSILNIGNPLLTAEYRLFPAKFSASSTAFWGSISHLQHPKDYWIAYNVMVIDGPLATPRQNRINISTYLASQLAMIGTKVTWHTNYSAYSLSDICPASQPRINRTRNYPGHMWGLLILAQWVICIILSIGSPLLTAEYRLSPAEFCSSSTAFWRSIVHLENC